MNNQNMPADWQPPAPAWESVFAANDQLVCGYFGIQAESPQLLDEWANVALVQSDGDLQFLPSSLERAIYNDVTGSRNYFYIAYWHAEQYLAWWSQSWVRDWWESDVAEKNNIGLWREIIPMLGCRLETLHSTEIPCGAAKLSKTLMGPIQNHGYSGAMRDRIVRDSGLNLRSDESLKLTSLSTGNRVLVSLPENACVIRSGQNWQSCGVSETKYYLEEMQPVLAEGMRFLRDNPAQSRTYNMRYATLCDRDWQEQAASFGLGYASDVYAFEQWANAHITHLAIFDTFLRMVDLFGEEIQLQLWHEVVALTDSKTGLNAEFEYINCHNKTGLLGCI